MKTDVWLDLWFAQQDYNHHLINDAEQEGLTEEEFKEHFEYLHMEYLTIKEDILRKYAANISKTQIKVVKRFDSDFDFT